MLHLNLGSDCVPCLQTWTNSKKLSDHVLWVAVIESHFFHDLDHFHYGEVVLRACGLCEVEILTYPTHVGGVVFLSDRDHGEEVILNAHVSGGELREVVTALTVVLQSQNADSLLGRANETFWIAKETESADEAEETEKVTCDVECLFHVADFGSSGHVLHDSLLVDP